MDREELVEHLNALDTKCAALLQLCGIMLTVGTIPAMSNSINGVRLYLSMTIAFVLVINCLISLSVLWYVPEPSEELFKSRSKAYKISVVLTGLGLVMIASLLTLNLMG